MNLANRFVRSATWEGLADRKEITDIVTAFAYAEGQAKEAGLDAIQIHSAHGFLLSGWMESGTTA
jgi:2,4-dienoyl-CoA reductase-like NADH-dependent reductase (Old Yellow Enzyme family)